MKDKEKILDRIRKLSRMAEDTSSLNEAEIAGKRLAALMAKYDISNADLYLSEDSCADITYDVFDEDKFCYKTTNKHWSQNVIIKVARQFDCQVRFNRLPNRKFGYKVMGYTADVTATISFAKSILHTIWGQGTIHLAATKGDRSTSAQVARASFSTGFINGVVDAMRKEKESHIEAGSSLVVVKKENIAKVFGDVSYGRATKVRRNVDSYSAGYTEGKQYKNQKLVK